MLSVEQRATITAELEFTTSRSGGKGGQNVNKVETQVEATFDISASNGLDETQKAILTEKTGGTSLREKSNRHRSQWQNKQEATEKLLSKIDSLLKPRKKRKPTKPSKAAKEKKLKAKRIQKEKKQSRSGRWD